MTEITVPGWVFLVIISFIMPLAALLSILRAGQATQLLTRPRYLLSVFAAQGMILLLALPAANFNDIPLFPAPDFQLTDFLLALGFLDLSVGTLPFRWAWQTIQEKRTAVSLLPHDLRDLGWWALVAIIAGVVEEIAYRGVLFALWQRLLGPGWATAICVAAFTLAHATQGWRAMATIALIAWALHGIVFLTGDLYTAILVHIIYDFLAGILMLYLARREQLLPVSPKREPEI